VETLQPQEAGEVAEALKWAAADEKQICIVGGDSKARYGRPVTATHRIATTAMSGIIFYEPEELVIRIKAGTLLSEIHTALASNRQHFGFETPDWGDLTGSGKNDQTIGGVVAANVSGPRRLQSGGVRDHLLGFEAINGRGEAIKSGGRVIKNVSGYDLPKLMCGSHGTLCVLTEVTLRLLPAPDEARTVAIAGLNDHRAQQFLSHCMQSSLEVSGAAHLSGWAIQKSALKELASLESGVTVVRVEGPADSVQQRATALKELAAREGFSKSPMSGRDGIAILGDAPSRGLWAEIRDAAFFDKQDGAIWRISVAPNKGPAVLASIGVDAYFLDWAGGLIWLQTQPSQNGDEPLVRSAVKAAGGHATLFSADDDVRRLAPVFNPQPPALAALTRRIKSAFDPMHILNPGRMYPAE
jgi:glycolate oxidase FAD binding subunit